MSQLRQFSRTDFEADGELSVAEELIFAEGFEGFINLGGKVPHAPTHTNTIRAGLIRALLLDEVAGVRLLPQGVLIQGAWITGLLDLNFCKIDYPILLVQCQSSDEMYMRNMQAKLISLRGSRLVGLDAEGVTVLASLLMRDVHCTGKINLTGAKIGGQLNLRGSVIDGDLGLQEARIEAGLIMDSATTCAQNLEMRECSIGMIVDHPNSWPSKGSLKLSGAIYTGFQGENTPSTARKRLEWLALMPEFHPQPYRQLAATFRAMGQDRDARDVLYEMEALRTRDHLLKSSQTIANLQRGEDDGLSEVLERYHGKTRRVNIGRIMWDRWFTWIFSRVFDLAVGFGYKLERAGLWIMGMIAALTILSSAAYFTGHMAPNSPVILLSPAWVTIDDPYIWATSEYAKDWENFFALVYAMDVVLPLIDFGQEAAWSPTTRGWLGWAVWALRWPFKLMGWLIVSLTIASMTGVMQRRQD